jgi:universal stress protein A
MIAAAGAFAPVYVRRRRIDPVRTLLRTGEKFRAAPGFLAFVRPVSAQITSARDRRGAEAHGMSIALDDRGDDMTFTRILVATDFSLDSDGAVAYALALAKTIPASIHLLHVVDNPLAAGVWSSDVYTAEIAGLQINLVREAEKQLRAGVRTLDRPGITITTEVRTGRPGRTIVDCARDRECDLVVVGSHGRTGVAHLIMGSVAEHVVRHAPCPVLVIRPIEHEAQRAAAAS